MNFLVGYGIIISSTYRICDVITMIQEVNEKDIPECVKVIRESFATVANEFGFTIENAPKFTAFATTEERLRWHLFGEHRPMYVFFDDGKIIGYYSLLLQNNECELASTSIGISAVIMFLM